MRTSVLAVMLRLAAGGAVVSGSIVSGSIVSGIDAASAQAPDGDAAIRPNGEWERAAMGFLCRVTAAKAVTPDQLKPEEVAKDCQHMGPFRIGDAAQSLKSVLGEPARTIPQPRNATGWVYFLEGAERYPYLVAVVKNDRIVALQITGPARAASRDYSFNHLDLGAGTDAVLRYFGPAMRTQPSDMKGTDLWTYGPWPFSFEITAGRVTSIRITEPAFHIHRGEAAAPAGAQPSTPQSTGAK